MRIRLRADPRSFGGRLIADVKREKERENDLKTGREKGEPKRWEPTKTQVEFHFMRGRTSRKSCGGERLSLAAGRALYAGKGPMENACRHGGVRTVGLPHRNGKNFQRRPRVLASRFSVSIRSGITRRDPFELSAVSDAVLGKRPPDA